MKDIDRKLVLELISKDNVDICITGKLYYDQYNMYTKLVKKYENIK